MSDIDDDYLDDPEILDFNENLDARAAAEENDPNEAFGLEMFGPSGRGVSPAVGRQSPYQLSRNAAASLRSVGLDESHLKDTKTWDTKVKEEEPQPKPQPLPKVVKAEVRPMGKARPPAKPPQKNYQVSVSDEKAEENADKIWMRMGHNPFKYHLPGGQFVYKLPDGSLAPIPWDQITLDRKPVDERRLTRPKGGTRKRSRKSSSRRNRSSRNKRSRRRRRR